jgi:predicted O-methyltransferase YrrM
MKDHILHTYTENQLFDLIKSSDNIEFVKNIVSKMEPDPVYGSILMGLLNNSLPETRSFVSFIAKTIQPSTYLEVGVRRGWSLGTVVSAAPECEVWAFDEWHENYGGSPNPGPAFIEQEMAKLGYTKPIHFVNGNSHTTLRHFFSENPNMLLDMILIDGDHTVDGAFQDLMDTMSHISINGAVVFDDILDCGGLAGVWNDMIKHFPNFRYYSFLRNKPGVGFAIRVS